MTEDELRALIRTAVEMHLGSAGPEAASTRAISGELRRDPAFGRGAEPLVSMAFGQYQLERAAGETSCLIEPAVRCNHCGFCKCHGH